MLKRKPSPRRRQPPDAFSVTVDMGSARPGCYPETLKRTRPEFPCRWENLVKGWEPFETVEKPSPERMVENVEMQGFRGPEE